MENAVKAAKCAFSVWECMRLIVPTVSEYAWLDDRHLKRKIP